MRYPHVGGYNKNLGQEKGGKGLGKGGAKRHLKVLRDSIKGITKPAIRRALPSPPLSLAREREREPATLSRSCMKKRAKPSKCSSKISSAMLQPSPNMRARRRLGPRMWSMPSNVRGRRLYGFD